MVEKAEPMHWLSPYRTFLLQPDAQFSMWFTLHEMMLQGKKDKLIQCFRNEAGQDNSLPKMIPSGKSPPLNALPLQRDQCHGRRAATFWMSLCRQRDAEHPQQCNGSTAERQLPPVKVEKSVSICWVYLILLKLVPTNTKGRRGREEKEGKKGGEKEEEMGGKVLIQRSWPFCQPNTWSSWGLPCISALFLTFSSQFLSFLFPIHQTSLRASPGISLLCNVCLLHDPLSIKKFLLL